MTRNHNLTLRRGVWYLRRRVSGRDVWRSLKTGDVKEARRLRDCDGGKLTGELGEQGDLLLCDAFPRFVNSLCRRECSASSLRGYESSFAALLRWLPAGVSCLRGVDSIAYSYVLHLSESGISAGTYNSHLQALGYVWRVLMQDCRAKGDPAPCERVPWADIRRKVSHSVNRLPFTSDHVRRLLLAAPDDEWRDLVIVAAHTGLRRADVVLLHSDSVDLGRGVLSVSPVKTRARSLRRAIIGMSDDVRSVLTCRKTDGLVFPEIAELYRVKPWAVGRAFETMVNAIGLHSRVAHSEGRARCQYGFHSFRHGFRMALMAGGVADSLVSIMLCHSQGAVADAYTHAESGLLDKQLIEAVGCLPSLSEPAVSNVVAFKVA